jgi:hypothetical protein
MSPKSKSRDVQADGLSETARADLILDALGAPSRSNSLFRSSTSKSKSRDAQSDELSDTARADLLAALEAMSPNSNLSRLSAIRNISIPNSPESLTILEAISPKQIAEMEEQREDEAAKQQTAARKLAKFFKNTTVKRREDKQHQSASRKLAKFFKNTTLKRRVRFLSTVCSNSNICITFGKEIKKINEFFDGFTTFKYMSAPATRIGAVSANGFVKLVRYSREGYNSSAILKSSVSSNSDNLYYEYLVGRFLNQFVPIFPCFLETYGAFLYDSLANWEFCKNNVETPKSVYEKLVPLKPSSHHNMLDVSCRFSEYLAVLIQSIPDAVSLKSKFVGRRYQIVDFINNELPGLLFQVYMPLAILNKVFTHYDLHQDNVLLHPLEIHPRGERDYVQYHYITQRGVISFKSHYIVKIIDYGRSYFKYRDADDSPIGMIDSKVVYDHVCHEPDCPRCGRLAGYYYLKPGFNTNTYISGSLNNSSHDLRLLNRIKPQVESAGFSAGRDDIYGRLFSKLKYDKEYGTKQRQNGYPAHINTVVDAFNALFDVLRQPNQIVMNDHAYAGDNQIGVLTVYDDGRPMEYKAV